jgi:phycocyanobilin lyase beta subunit
MIDTFQTDTFQLRLQAVNQADSSQDLIDAVEALAELRDPRTISALIEVLGFNNPGAAVAAVEGLIQIGIPAVDPLLQQLDDYNYGARAWAIRALAGIGDPRGQELLLQAAAEDFALSVRRAAARGLGYLRWQMVPLEDRLARQLRSHRVLIQVTQDEEWVVRYAAIVGLQALITAFQQHPVPANEPIAMTMAHLQSLAQQDPTLAVRARAQRALRL